MTIENNKFYEIYSDYFKDKILPYIKPYEKKRRKNIFRVILFSCLFLILGIAAAYGFFYLFLHSLYNSVIWTVVLFLIYGLFFRSIIYHVEVSKEFEDELSENLLKPFLKPMANFMPWPHNHNKESIIDSEIFPNFVIQDDAKSFFGFYNKTNIMITDTSLSSVTAFDKRDLFKGAVIQLELEKSINNHIIIQPVGMRKPLGFKLMNLQNNAYANFAEVYSKNQDADITFVDEEFLRLLEYVAMAYSAYTLRMSIKDNIVVISIPSKKKVFYIAGMFKSLIDIRTYDEIINKFISVFNIVDKLNK